jgi:tetratricopeptide (TPR) repeat protein
VKPALQHAIELHREGKLDEAFALIVEARRDAPLDLEFAIMHAQLLSARGEHDAAIELLEPACISVPVETRGLLLALLALEYDAVGNKDDAMEMCRAAIACGYTSSSAMLFGAIAMERGEHAQALAVLRRVLDTLKPKARATVERTIAAIEANTARSARP